MNEFYRTIGAATLLLILTLASGPTSASQDTEAENKNDTPEFNFQQEIEYNRYFERKSETLTREEWLENPGKFYEPPSSVGNTEYFEYMQLMYQFMFDALNSKTLKKSYEKCKANSSDFISKFTELANKQIDAAKTKEEKLNYTQIRDRYAPIKPSLSASMCAYRVIRRSLVALGVPNYFPEQNRLNGSVFTYETLRFGQVFRATHAMTNGFFTDTFYRELAKELEIPEADWSQREIYEALRSIPSLGGINAGLINTIHMHMIESANEISYSIRNGNDGKFVKP